MLTTGQIPQIQEFQIVEISSELHAILIHLTGQDHFNVLNQKCKQSFLPGKNHVNNHVAMPVPATGLSFRIENGLHVAASEFHRSISLFVSVLDIES